MSAVSGAAQRESVAVQRGFEVKIPSGSGWAAKPWIFNADSLFERLTGETGARLSIIYNFGSFDFWRGCSRLFDESSPYYNSFYGAYLAQLPNGAVYGFTPEGEADAQAPAALARMDFFGLVLGDFGLEPDEQVFEYTLEDTQEKLDFAGFPDWTRLDAKLQVNGAAHEAKEWVQSYWQYGRPNYPVTGEFAPVEMYCTVIARYFEQWETTVFFYVMTPDEGVRDECVDTILARAQISQ
jgi:hypothetical protein